MGQLEEELQRSAHAGGTHVQPGTPAQAAVAPDRVRAVLLRLASAGEMVQHDVRTLGLVSTRARDQLAAALGQAWQLLRPGDEDQPGRPDDDVGQAGTG